ncbi:GNVR domain-containing protein [Chromobacterium amazonense]|uniref:GNVR domain-containing protein n=1 Tax=Chromobacterium amazonense TaxID=1382803 RepID=A0ABU8V1A2_9NEIS|nr:GNVR domain-containing protein [Chromobacterium amazonense]MDQ4542253.1 GNVR domain-containing protein [Chromobacterium amazonense]
MLVFAVIAAVIVLQMPNQYESKTLLSIPAPVGAQGGMAIAQSGATLDGLMDRYDLQKRYRVEGNREAKLELLNRIKASATKEGLLELSVRDQDPELAASMAGALAAMVRQQILDSHATEQSKRLFVLRGRLDIARKELDNDAGAIEKMGLRNRLSLDGNAEQILIGFASLDAQYALGEKDGLMGNLLQLRAELEKGNSSLYKLPGEQLKLLRDFYFNRALADELQKQVRVAELQAAQDVQVVLPAVTPLEKAGPKRSLMVVLSALAGLILTSGLCLILQWRRQRQAELVKA